MHWLLPLIAALFILGCSDKPSDETTSSSDNSVGVFTVAPVLNAIVTDAANQVGSYDPVSFRYRFDAPITFPVTVRTGSDTFVDIDYDGVLSATDLKPAAFFATDKLMSFCNEVNPLTDLYYSQNYQDANISSESFKNDIATRFGVDICSDVRSHEETAKVVFATYDHLLQEGNLTLIEDINGELAHIEALFSDSFSQISDKIGYYSAYDALVQLDAHRLQRTDTLHRPDISGALRESVILLADNANLDVRDLYSDGSYIYSASAHDEFAQLDISLGAPTFFGDGNTDSFGQHLYAQEYNATQCLFLANGNDGILSFEAGSSGASQQSRIYRYEDSSGNFHNLTDQSVVATNGFVSISENKRLLGISTRDNGFYLFNVKDHLNNCTLSNELNTTSMLIQNNSQSSVSSAFRDDGSYVYVANAADGITRYDLSTLSQADINSSKQNFTLYDNAEAYSLKLYPNSNELLVTTNKGLQLYDITNDENLTYVSSYMTEGSQSDYIADIEVNGDFVVLTDGYSGVKIVRLSSSYQPELCGAEYFAPPNDPYALAKSSSVFYQNGYLYIGFESYGIMQVRFSDLLFRHCR